MVQIQNTTKNLQNFSLRPFHELTVNIYDGTVEINKFWRTSDLQPTTFSILFTVTPQTAYTHRSGGATNDPFTTFFKELKIKSIN